MATDSEKLILSISADVTQVKRALAKLSGDTKTETDKMKTSLDSVGQRTKLVAANMNEANNSMTVSMKQTRAATVNMTAQFNDIAQQLAAGTSPLNIMAQQTSQVAQAMQAAGGGVKGFATTVVGAFKGMLSWQSLVAAGSILALGALVEYFKGAEDSAKEAEKKLEAHKKLIEDVGKAWDLAKGKLTDYFTASRNETGAELAQQLEKAQAELEAARKNCWPIRVRAGDRRRGGQRCSTRQGLPASAVSLIGSALAPGRRSASHCSGWMKSSLLTHRGSTS